MANKLVILNAGIDVSIERVKLEIRDVHAEAYLRVRLDNVRRVVEEVRQHKRRQKVRSKTGEGTRAPLSVSLTCLVSFSSCACVRLCTCCATALRSSPRCWQHSINI